MWTPEHTHTDHVMFLIILNYLLLKLVRNSNTDKERKNSHAICITGQLFINFFSQTYTHRLSMNHSLPSNKVTFIHA